MKVAKRDQGTQHSRNRWSGNARLQHEFLIAEQGASGVKADSMARLRARGITIVRPEPARCVVLSSSDDSSSGPSSLSA